MLFRETDPYSLFSHPNLQPLLGLTAAAKANPKEASSPTLVT